MLRHSCDHALAHAERDLRLIQDYLGHRDTDMPHVIHAEHTCIAAARVQIYEELTVFRALGHRLPREQRMGWNKQRLEFDMGMLDRRRLMRGIGVVGVASLVNARMTVAEDIPGSDPLPRAKVVILDPLALPGFSSLEFATAWPKQIDWFENAETISDFNESGMFTEFQRLWLGYEPGNRDQLTFSIYCARIVPERVAVAPDYARLLTSVWGPKNYDLFGDDRDFGEVLTGGGRQRL